MTESINCCTRCGNNILVSRTESRLKDGLFVGYCYDPSHSKIKFRIITGTGIVRTIRDDRMKMKTEYEVDYSMAGLSCICGKKLFFSKKGSYTIAGRVNGSCFAEKHRVELTIIGKLFKHEPAFEELQEIIVRKIGD